MDRKSCLACSVPFIPFAGVLVAGIVLTVIIERLERAGAKEW